MVCTHYFYQEVRQLFVCEWKSCWINRVSQSEIQIKSVFALPCAVPEEKNCFDGTFEMSNVKKQLLNAVINFTKTIHPVQS